MPTAQVGERLTKGDPSRLPLFKQIILLYRRSRAAYTESKTEKTFHLELTDTLEQEVKALDALVNAEWFERVETRRLPRLKDFLPVQLIEAAAVHQVLLPRQYDQKFLILQAPNLFLPDLAYFRTKCEDRESPPPTRKRKWIATCCLVSCKPWKRTSIITATPTRKEATRS